MLCHAVLCCAVFPPGKLSVLHRLLVKLHERGHRVVLFSQFTMMLGILEDYLSLAGFE
jgi:SNF2 family DNA or RNA helicase